MGSRGRILWIHPGGLLPVGGGGAARTWAIIDVLRAHGYELELVTGNQGAQNESLESRVDRLWIESRNKGNKNRARRDLRTRARSFLKVRYKKLDPDLRLLHYFTRQTPVTTDMISFNRRRSLEEYAGRVAWEDPPLAAFVSYAWLAPALDRMPPGVLRLIDTHDIQHERRSVAAAAGGDLSHINCTREDECRELNRADVILAIQPEEQSKLEAMCPERDVVLTEHAYPTPPYVPSPDDGFTLLYVGNRYDPNILGLRSFLKEVWPRVHQEEPKLKLSVCGRVCDVFRRPHPGVTFHGRVPDLQPYYEKAIGVINPVPYGTGIKIKTIEGLAHGRVVVCSEAGTCGLGDPEQLPLFVTKNPEAMAAAILQVTANPDERHAMEQRAWAYANEHFAPDRVYAALLDRIEQHRNERFRGGAE